MWLKVAAGIFFLINLSSGSPLSQLHNNDVDVVEAKYKLIENNVLDVAKISPRYVPTTYRLPNNSIPLSYDLEITTDVDKGLSRFTGSVKIHIRVVTASQEIILHYRQTTIDIINLLSVDGTTVISTDLSYEQISGYEFLVVTLPNVVNPNAELVLEIKYNAEHRSDGGGFYRSSYTNAAGAVVWYATTQFEIDDARHAMPCYDEPGIRAPITASIRHGKGFTAVSNTDVDTITDEGDYYLTKFLPTPSIQTYLLAFLVSDYEYVNATNTRISQKIYARPSLIESGYGDFAATVVGPILRGLEEHLGVNYPITKMDHAALTLFNFGAMENIGLITYTENGLLYNPSTLPASERDRKMSITRLIAHEYVHQWFGNIVSPVWWSYVWLNEGFATLLQSYISELVYPEINYMSNFVTGDMPRAFSVDVLSQNSWAMNHYTEEPARLWDKFGGIGYQKSGCVLRMFQEVMTPATFAKGLNYYLTKMYMQAAIPDDLHEGLQRAYNEDNIGNALNIGELMHTWEDQPGYPMITVQILNDNVVFSQRRYPGSAGEIYSVPITIATTSDANFNRKTPTIWLKDQVNVFTQSELGFRTNDWMILNIQQVGYYRVNYDTSIWQAIIRQLNEDHTVINSINRAVLQDEIYLALTDSSLSSVDVSDCLNILNYFGAENEPIAWSKANTLLTLLNTRLFATSVYESYLTFLRQITSPHLSEIGYEAVDYEPSNRTSLRASTKSWNCLALDDDCFDNEHEKFLQFYNGTIVGGTFDYCVALRTVDSSIYSTIVAGVASNSNYPSRTNYLNNLGCSLQEENLRQFLNIVLDSTNTLSETERQNVLINTMRRSVLGLEATIAFIDENYRQIDARIGSFTNVLQTMASLINTDEYVGNIEALITKLLENGVNLNASLIRSTYLDNIKWQNEHYTHIEEWFSSPAPTIVLSFGLFIACLMIHLRV